MNIDMHTDIRSACATHRGKLSSRRSKRVQSQQPSHHIKNDALSAMPTAPLDEFWDAVVRVPVVAPRGAFTSPKSRRRLISRR